MKKILFITYKRLGSVMEGGGQVALKNYNALCRLVGEKNVTPYYVHNDDSKRSLLTYLQGVVFAPFGYYFGLTPRKVKAIMADAMQYDCVFIDRSLFGIIAKQLKKQGYKGKIITYYHNIEAVYVDAKLNKRMPLRSMLINCADCNDRFGCEYSDITIALNERDSRELQKRYNRKADLLVPVTLTDRLSATPDTSVLTCKKPLCLFLGAYFAANNEGILWFVRNVLPHVDIDIKIVGKGMARLKQEAVELKDIEVISDAPDLTPYFEDADIMVLPIFSGSGMKVKTCESLMYGKNIIGTDEAFEGYGIDGDKVGARCNTADEFINAIQSFIDSPRPRFNQYSRQLFLKNHTETAVIELYRQLLKL